MNPHYICTGGCGGVSDTPGTCQATDCPNHGQPLETCTCKDGSHGNKNVAVDPDMDDETGETIE